MAWADCPFMNVKLKKNEDKVDLHQVNIIHELIKISVHTPMWFVFEIMAVVT